MTRNLKTKDMLVTSMVRRDAGEKSLEKNIPLMKDKRAQMKRDQVHVTFQEAVNRVNNMNQEAVTIPSRYNLRTQTALNLMRPATQKAIPSGNAVDIDKSMTCRQALVTAAADEWRVALNKELESSYGWTHL